MKEYFTEKQPELSEEDVRITLMEIMTMAEKKSLENRTSRVTSLDNTAAKLQSYLKELRIENESLRRELVRRAHKRFIIGLVTGFLVSTLTVSIYLFTRG